MTSFDSPLPSTTPVPSQAELASLGEGRLAYLRALRSEDAAAIFPGAADVPPGLALFALLGADGTPILLTDSRDAALGQAMEQSLEAVSVH